MKQGWEIRILGDVCSFVRGPFGGSLKKNIFKPEGYAVYEQQHAIYDQFNSIRYFIDEDKFNEMERFQLNSGDLIMSCSGTMGKIAIVPENIKKGIINQALLKLSPSEKVSNIFLKLWMQSESFQDSLKEYSGGAAIQNVASVKILKNIAIPLPPLPEQQRIVAILNEAFPAIAKAKANAEQNLKNAKELFESYLQGVFDNKGVGWEEKTLGEVCEIKPPKKEARDKLKETDIVTFLPMKDLGVLNKEIIGIQEKQFKDVAGSYTYFADNDVLLAKITPCFENGKIGIARNLINGIGFGSSEYIIFRTDERIKPDFLYYFLSRKQIRKEGSKRMTGAVGHKRVSKDWIENYLFSFPTSKEEQWAIVKKLDVLSTETKKLEAIYQQKIQNLEELKKSVLQKAFKGKLTEKEIIL
mgnify:CR=1 FL=1